MAGRPVAVEVLDPGCRYCAELFRNMQASGFDDTHNVTYLAYPIRAAFGDKFANSELVASYLAAVRAFEADRGGAAGETGDWFILEQLFTSERSDGQPTQEWMNAATAEEARAQLEQWLADAGYAPDEVAQIARASVSPDVAATLERTRRVVEDDIRTVAIPSLIAGGRLHAGLVDVDTLRAMD